jgi:hypothetical protein
MSTSELFVGLPDMFAHAHLHLIPPLRTRAYSAYTCLWGLVGWTLLNYC